MLENPVDPPLLAAITAAVTTREVRKTSRKGSGSRWIPRILRDHTPALFGMSSEEDEMVRTLRRRREAGGNAQPAYRGVVPPIGSQVTDSSEIPCRVSSDLHEWSNDFPTVSTMNSVKLHYE